MTPAVANGRDGFQLTPAIHLPSLTDDEREALLTDLREWVAQLVDRFCIDVRVVPPCWERHPGMAEALAALRDHERASYALSASPTEAVDWFRAYREIEARLIDLAARTQCSVHEHRDPPRRRDLRDEHPPRRSKNHSRQA